MKRFLSTLLLSAAASLGFAQLNDIKIIIPKEFGFTYYDFLQFLPGEKYHIVCGNALSVVNTETSEVVDEVDLSFGAKNLSVSGDGKYISVTINNELHVYTFAAQKLRLFLKVGTADLISGQPNGQYYGSLPVGGAAFTAKSNEIYVSIGSFTLLYNIETKSVVSSFAFPVADYVVHSGLYNKKQEAILFKTTGQTSSVVRQSLTDLSKFSEVITNTGAAYKIRVRDSLAFCFTADKYFALNLETGKVVHEIRAPIYDLSNYDEYKIDKKYLEEANKRPALTKPDTINFSRDEYIYDMDLISKQGLGVYATSKGLKLIDLRTHKLRQDFKGIFMNIKVSNNGTRMVSNGYTPYKALRVHDPLTMKLISERPSMGNPIYSASMSPNNRWLYTNCGGSGFLWDLRNFSKYAEVRDISGSDTSFIYNTFFLNDSTLMVNSGKDIKSMNLCLYNINKKKYEKVLKKGVLAFSSGFLNGEFYYCTYTSLNIINLKTMAEEKYEGLFSLAASPMYKIVNYTNDLVFVPEAGKYKIVNRKTKKTEYESTSWSVTGRVLISPDGKYVYTPSQITKKKNFNGVDVDMPVNAIVKIDMSKKEIVQDFAQTYFPYDCVMKNGGKVIGIWYIKHDVANYSEEKETVYSEYDTETGKELFSKTLLKTKDIISFHFTSENGKYFALNDPTGTLLKVFDEKGDLVIDLSDTKVAMPNCFFIESREQLIVTSTMHSLATFVDLKKKKVTGQLANASKDDFFLITSDLHYLGSKDFVKSIRFKYESEIFSFEQFDAYLNQPHNVLRAFGCSDSALIGAYEAAYLKRMKVLNLKPESAINFSAMPTLQFVKMKESKAGTASFALSANKGKNNLANLVVYNNGSQVLSEPIPADQSAKYDKELLFETSSGINRFEFIIRDEMGLESPRITRFFNNTDMVKPDLYLVVIGSEKFKNNAYDLSYAVKDATDMANTMTNSKSFRNVVTRKIFNQSFNTDSIRQLGAFFSKAGVNDVVMVFFAGHGYLDGGMNYYFPTYYTDFSDPKINSVAYKDFEKLFQEMKPTRKLMFIDACFSGEVDEDGGFQEKKQNGKDSTRAVLSTRFGKSTVLEMSKAVFSDLRQNSGATIISSAGGREAAFEGGEWNNGLFTHCLLDALSKMKADENRDKKVTLSELQKYVSVEVSRLSGGKQTPTYRMENTVLDYELW